MKKVLFKLIFYILIWAVIFNFNLIFENTEAQTRTFDLGSAVDPSVVWYHDTIGWHNQSADATDAGENDVILTTDDAGEAAAEFAHYVG